MPLRRAPGFYFALHGTHPPYFLLRSTRVYLHAFQNETDAVTFSSGLIQILIVIGLRWPACRQDCCLALPTADSRLTSANPRRGSFPLIGIGLCWPTSGYHRGVKDSLQLVELADVSCECRRVESFVNY